MNTGRLVRLDHAARAVGHRRRDRELAAAADLHALDARVAAGARRPTVRARSDVDAQGMANIAYTDNLNTPPAGSDPHQEWVTFVQQKAGKGLYGK